MKIENVMFDLDGTLTDSFEGVANCIIYALEKMKKPLLNTQQLRRFLGPPLPNSFMKYCGMDEKEAFEAVAIYRERYNPIGVFENRLYDGTKELLEYLKSKNMRLFVATSKPQYLADTVIKHFDIDKYFDLIQGVDPSNTRADKTDILKYIVEKYNLDIKKTAMVGDRYFDIDAAKNIGALAIGMLNGCDTMSEFKAHEADVVVENATELKKYFENLK